MIVGPGFASGQPQNQPPAQRGLQRGPDSGQNDAPAAARRLCVADDTDAEFIDDEDEQRQAARRVLFAMLLAMIATPAILLLLVWAKIEMSPMLVVLIVGAVVGGAIFGASPSQRPRATKPLDEGRPIGCCGPRPLRSFRDRRG